MLLVFPWGTVSDAPGGGSFGPRLRLTFAKNLTFVVGDLTAGTVARYAEGRPPSILLLAGNGNLVAMSTPTTTGFLYLAWEPLVLPITAKSVLKVGQGALTQLAPGTTPTILNRDEAKELVDAIRKLRRTKGAQTATTP